MPRHVPKPAKFLVELDKVVNDRAVQLRGLSLQELTGLPTGKLDDLVIEARRTTIHVIVEMLPSGGVSVLLEGRMKALHIPGMERIAWHGFFRALEGNTTEMSRDDCYYLAMHYMRRGEPSLSF